MISPCSLYRRSKSRVAPCTYPVLFHSAPLTFIPEGRSEHGIDMETSLADAAAQRKRSKALRMYRRPGRVYQHQTGGRYFRQREAEAGTQSTTHRCEKDATHSGPSGPIGGIGGGTWSTAPGGAYPPDRFKGRRIRCKALLSSSHPNDLGREVRYVEDLEPG